MKAHRIALTLTLLAAATGAAAQATIDHQKALAGSVTPGDAAGYPVTITVPGHYVLKSNLQVPHNTPGIVVAASGVTLDLNGFTIAGPGTCTQTTATRVVTCSLSGLNDVNQRAQMSGITMLAGSTAYSGNTVRNGTVRGFRAHGIWGHNLEIENMVLRENRASGYSGNNSNFDFSRISGSRLYLNREHGVHGGYTLFERSSAMRNGLHGLFGSGFQVVHSRLSYNYMHGLSSGSNPHSTMRASHAQSNGQGATAGGVISQGGNYNGGAALF